MPETWKIEATAEYLKWFGHLDSDSQDRVQAVTELLEERGPALGRPYVDSVRGSRHPNMKEIRVRTHRILFAFDPERTAVLLIGGDKSGQWQSWYPRAIGKADRLYARHLAKRR